MHRDWPRRAFEDEEEEWDEELEDEGDCPDGLEVEGPSYAPIFTGLFHANGDPILRHPVVVRMGFHPPDQKYHCPTLEDNGFAEDDGKIFGWVYD